MINYLLTCRSLTYAQRAARVLGRTGIKAVIMRTPPNMSPEGCGYCIRIPERQLAYSLVELKEAGLSPVRIFAQFADGQTREAEL